MQHLHNWPQTDMRPYAGQINTTQTTEHKYLQTGKELKKVLLPEGTSYESLTNVRDYHDLFCALNDFFNVSRSAALNDFNYLVQVSEHSCLALQSKVWNYFGLSINNLLLDPYPLSDALIEILTSDKPVICGHVSLRGCCPASPWERQGCFVRHCVLHPSRLHGT